MISSDVIWSQHPNAPARLCVAVGAEAGDFRGRSDRAIQAAVDYVAGHGGGTVRVLKGIYELDNAVHLRSNVALVGEGDDTILRKRAARASAIRFDLDWYDTTVEVADPTAFPAGTGVFLQCDDPLSKVKATVVGCSGNRLLLDRQPRKNFWADKHATVSSLFPIVTGNFVHDLTIRDLTLDGNRDENDLMDGNYGGCIFLQDCERVTIQRVHAHHYHGDGISFQIVHDVLVEDCRSTDHAHLGLHPGSGSQRPTMRRNTIERNRIGLFFCWGVQHGTAEDNQISDSRDFGISVGHRDTDNLIRRNTILRSGKVGILFREEASDCRAPHRNTVEDNLIDGFGSDQAPGVGLEVQGMPRDLVIRRNRFVGDAEATVGIRFGEQAGSIAIADNEFVGVSHPLEDRRTAVGRPGLERPRQESG